MDDGTSNRAASAARTGRLEALASGQAIPFAGDRVAFVTPELAAAFRPGDRLVVVQDTGDLLHIPEAEAEAAGGAVARAAAAFARMGDVPDAAITAFFEAFARRLEDDSIWAAIAAATSLPPPLRRPCPASAALVLLLFRR